MTSLVLACAFFVGIHVVISGSPLRGAIVAVLGERRYLGLFSLLSLGGMVWMVAAYRVAPSVPLWGTPTGFDWIALGLILIGFLFVAIGIATPSPTAAGGESRLDAPEPAQGILRVTRHPFLWGVALWAFTHLVLNGNSASVVLFGSLLLLALVGPPLIDAKRQRAFGAKWERFAAVTSNLPFGAIAGGRNHLRLDEIGLWGPVAGLIAFGAFLSVHRWLFGVSPLPR